MEEVIVILGLSPGVRVGHLIGLLERLIRAEISRELAPMGLSFQQFAALLILYSQGSISNAELARTSWMTRQSANETVTAMESNGLIVRRQDPQHKRRRLITLTPRGEAALKQADKMVMAIERRILANLSEDEQIKLQSDLTSCLVALGETKLSTES